MKDWWDMSRAEQMWHTYKHNIRPWQDDLPLQEGMIIKTRNGEYFLVGNLTISDGLLWDQGCLCWSIPYYKDQIEEVIYL